LGYQLKPAAQDISKPPVEMWVNSLDTPLDERATLFSNRVLTQLQMKNLVRRTEWAVQILKFLSTSRGVQAQMDRVEAGWPFALPWSLSTLYDNPGVVSVFVVRSADKAGVLEKMEVSGQSGAVFTRQYWSRSLNDPTYLEAPYKILDKVSMGFLRVAKQKRPSARKGTVDFVIDKAVSERDVIALENLIRPFALGHEHLLMPVLVDAKGVRYNSPMGLDNVPKMMERLERGLAKSNLAVTWNGTDAVVLSPKSSN
jgi:hypothetical protein